MPSEPTSKPHRRTSITGHQLHTHLEVKVETLPEPKILVEGELDLASSAIIDAAVAEIDPAPGDTVILDLSGVTFIDVAGLDGILDAKERLSADGNRMVIVSVSEPVTRLLDVLNRIGSPTDL